MEIVYLWVEDYKNIKRQGFNFSPRFHCKFKDEYDEEGKLKDNCELVICDKKKKECKDNDYIENFFGDNINVTAIVGKNGSGKSSLLEILLNSENSVNKIILVLKMEDKYIVYTDINLQSFGNYNIKLLDQIEKSNLFSIYYSSNFTNGSLNSELELFVTQSQKLQMESDSPMYTKSKNVKTRVQTLLNLVFNANRIITTNPSNSAYMQKNAFTISDMLNNYQIAKTITILHFIKIFGKDFLPFKVSKDEKIRISIVQNQHTNGLFGLETSYVDLVEKFVDKKSLEREEVGYSSNLDMDKQNEERLKSYNPVKNKFISFLKEKIDSTIIASDTIELSLDDSLLLLDMYITLYRINENFPSPLFNWDFKYLSSGEENFVLMFALILSGIEALVDKNNEVSNIILMLDEIENNLHPMWQKEIFSYIHYFLHRITDVFLRQYKHKISFTILIASHSPFLLSDIPEQNIIFLDKDEKGNCKVVDGLKDKKETFGANIHTLLSDSFFMEDGLMGEFAKTKIEDVINYLNNQKSDINDNDEAQKLIDIIGEPIIRNQLQKMLDSKSLTRIDDIDSIKTEISNLEKRLKDIEDANNKT